MPEGKSPTLSPLSKSVSNGLDGSPVCHKLGTSPSIPSKHLKNTLEAQRDKILERHLPLAADLAIEYRRIAEKLDYDSAIQRISQLDQRLTLNGTSLTCDTKELRELAQRLATSSRHIILRKIDTDALSSIETLLLQYRLTPIKSDDIYADLNRYADEKWCFTNLKGIRLSTIESIKRDLGFINKEKSLYCSDWAKREYEYQALINAQFMENKKLTNACGEEFSLAELASKNVSNPRIRRAELMVRIKGFEEVADLLELEADFITMTTPSRMHAALHNGKINPKYDGTTVKEANDYLLYQWQKIRSELAKKDIRIFGFRVAEPHHDGTPHAHFLLFIDPSERDQFRRIFKKYALQDSPNEPGAQKYRFKAELIDKNKGTAAGYIAKYISKGIDGHGLDKDLHDNDSKDSANRIRYWASTWGIRQFQQIGGPSVSVWRELRRISESIGMLIVGRAWSAADSSNWAAFVLAMGGPTVKRKEATLSPHYDFRDSVDTETGEVVSSRFNRYGEKIRPPISGISFRDKDFNIPTRLIRWHSERKLQALEATECSLDQRDEGCFVESSGNLSMSEKIFNLFKYALPVDTQRKESPRSLSRVAMGGATAPPLGCGASKD